MIPRAILKKIILAISATSRHEPDPGRHTP